MFYKYCLANMGMDFFFKEKKKNSNVPLSHLNYLIFLMMFSMRKRELKYSGWMFFEFHSNHHHTVEWVTFNHKLLCYTDMMMISIHFYAINICTLSEFNSADSL